MGKPSYTGGVKPMAIAGRTVDERERLYGMSDEERAWRKQYLKDQILSPNEPKPVPEMYKATFNPIRRAYRWPLDQLAKVIEPVVGPKLALPIRYYTGKALLFAAAAYYTTYYFMYNQNDWTRKGGWKVLESRTSCVPGDRDIQVYRTNRKDLIMVLEGLTK